MLHLLSSEIIDQPFFVSGNHAFIYPLPVWLCVVRVSEILYFQPAPMFILYSYFYFTTSPRIMYEPLLCADDETLKKDREEGGWCISCDEFEMYLSDNGLVYECHNCGHWEYSSS